MEKTRRILTTSRHVHSEIRPKNVNQLGRLQIYTGNGKGKTTAALGILLRAVGAGLRVCLIQFAKRGSFSEIVAIKSAFPKVKILQFGTGRFIIGQPSDKDILAAQKALAAVVRAMRSGRFDVVIADEAITAASMKLFPQRELLDLARARPANVELILTGRRAAPSLVRRAHLVTEMKEIKHYYRCGIPARKGIEM